MDCQVSLLAHDSDCGIYEEDNDDNNNDEEDNNEFRTDPRKVQQTETPSHELYTIHEELPQKMEEKLREENKNDDNERNYDDDDNDDSNKNDNMTESDMKMNERKRE